MSDHQLVLHRHWTVNARPTSLTEHDAARRSDLIVDFPPVPASALPRLRAHLMGQSDDGHDITWHHRSGLAWGAVQDLHQAGADDDATSLAVFLRWVDARGSRDDQTIWVLSEA